MHRFFFAGGCQGEELSLAGSEAHHASQVLRVQRAEQVLILNGCGVERLAEVMEAKNGRVRLRILETRIVPPLPYRITLVQAVPKGKLFEGIIQKASELGAFRIVPLLSERVIVHLDEHGLQAKAAKWQGVAIEAIKQCGSAWLPKVENPCTIHQLLNAGYAYDLSMVGALTGTPMHPRISLREFHRVHGRRPVTVCVWIGPEGDFTPAELEVIQSAGARPITLGHLVLRTETAATYCLSFLNYELQAPPD